MDALIKVGPLRVQFSHLADVRDNPLGFAVVSMRDGRKSYLPASAAVTADARRYAPASAVLAKAPGGAA